MISEQLKRKTLEYIPVLRGGPPQQPQSLTIPKSTPSIHPVQFQYHRVSSSSQGHRAGKERIVIVNSSTHVPPQLTPSWSNKNYYRNMLPEWCCSLSASKPRWGGGGRRRRKALIHFPIEKLLENSINTIRCLNSHC